MAYPNRTPEDQAAVDERKYAAWNKLKSGVGNAIGKATGPEAGPFQGGLMNPAVNLGTAMIANRPRIDWRSPAEQYTPERTAQVVKDFRSSLPGPEAGKPTFADKRPVGPRQPGALDAAFQQSPIPGPRTLTPQGLGLKPPQYPVNTGALPGEDQGNTRAMPAQYPANTGSMPAQASGLGPFGIPLVPEFMANGGPAPRGRFDPNNLKPGQGWAQVQGGPRYEIDGEQIRKFGSDGSPLPMGGAVNVMSPEDSRNMFPERKDSRVMDVGGQQMYDPDALAEAQFQRIKNAADSLMRQSTETWAGGATFYTDADRAAMRQAAIALYGQLGGANNAGVAAGAGIAQEGVRGQSNLVQEQLRNQGGLQQQESRNAGLMGLQGLQGSQTVDLEKLKHGNALESGRLLNEREYLKLMNERQDKMAEQMAMTTYDPQTGMPMGQVPANKYVYGQAPQQPKAQGQGQLVPGKLYRDAQGNVQRYTKEGTWVNP